MPAVVVHGEDHIVEADELIAYIRANLATYKCPSRVVFTEQMPRNASGKPLKNEMRRIHKATS